MVARTTARDLRASKRKQPPSPGNQQAMPLADGPMLPSRYEDDDLHTSSSMVASKKLCRKPSRGDDSDVDMASSAAPMSPRVRKRLDEAKENASVFGPVCEQGEVVQWMMACHPGLLAFGRELERRGFTTLSSIAFLTEEDLDLSLDLTVRQLLLSTLARLRHEFFRM